MKSAIIIRTILILSIVSLNIGCDQISKQLVRHNISTEESLHFLGNHLMVTRLENTGAFLSAGDTLSGLSRKIILAILPLAALAFGLIFILTRTNISRASVVGASFVIGGGIGNIFDRMVHGSVTDFLYLHAGWLHTGVFNAADLSILTGSAILLLHYILNRKSKS